MREADIIYWGEDSGEEPRFCDFAGGWPVSIQYSFGDQHLWVHRAMRVNVTGVTGGVGVRSVGRGGVLGLGE